MVTATLYLYFQTGKQKMAENLLDVSSFLNPCPAEPRYTLPLQTV